MLFEVPVDHFPVQRAAPERPQRPFLLRIPQISLIQRQEVSAAVEPLSPSVRRSQFMFPKAPVASSSSEESSRTVVADIPVERKASRRSPARLDLFLETKRSRNSPRGLVGWIRLRIAEEILKDPVFWKA
ncbi:hypothetical protein ANCCEY_09789 [Ancylostoma ceylanicum]|uniref:Uncharacterized protein n=1 Tax=Ancylostoma ceylanicum TaxID=53326 RepID=A0A0D6LIV8_9BILA|nr:hypothetical protein ANCCEY_09789 [Ancylostoma ceylanicum]